MKITIDTKNNNQIKVGSKTFDELDEYKKDNIMSILRSVIINNSNLSDYEEDSMWMSYRYCIGRHTIASHMRASDIWKNCKGRMSKERQLFTAFDINREIEQKLQFGSGPDWFFPITSLNKIYTTAVDIVCQFMEDYNIKSKEDLLKYYKIDVILTDNEQGYKLETTTWEEYLRSKVIPFLRKYYKIEILRNEESLWNRFVSWRNKEDVKFDKEIIDYFEEITKDIPNPENYYMHDFEDLFVWNDLVHCFDYAHHHKSILIDGTECEWFWTWTENTEKREDGYYYKSFGYKKIRVPVDKWNGSVTTWIPDESIKENLY